MKAIVNEVVPEKKECVSRVKQSIRDQNKDAGKQY